MKKLGLFFGAILLIIALGIGASAIFGLFQYQDHSVTVSTSYSASSASSKPIKSKPSQASTSSEENISEDSSSQMEESKTSLDNSFTALQNGDFSILAGSWTNGEGNTVQISPDGKTTAGSVISITRQNHNYIQGNIYVPNGGGAAFFYIPAGVPYVVSMADGTETTIESDTSRDRILIAQALSTTSSFFYKN